MTRSSWFGGLVALSLVLGAGCGGPQPLSAFKDGKVLITYGPGSFTTTPTPPGRYVISILLQPGGFPCAVLESDATATLNGDIQMNVGQGSCGGFKGSSSPGFAVELDVNDVPQDATFVFSDDGYQMKVQVENLLAAYRLQPRKPGFDPDLEFQDGANPVMRGEVLIFDRTPSVRDAASFSAILSQEHMVGTAADPRFERTEHDVQPTLTGAELRLTVPGDVSDGRAELSIMATEAPAILACDGVRSCEAEISSWISTSVTVQP